MKDDTLYLIHISECIARVESYTQGMTKEVFLKSSMVQDAVIRNCVGSAGIGQVPWSAQRIGGWADDGIIDS